ncbi:MAG: hypothetical protein ACKOU7_03320 [Ferruginibacter sp.]
MENYYLPEIDSVGRKHVETWLSENGYIDIKQVLFNSKDSGFIAKGKIEGVIVRIRTFLYPQRPFKLSVFELNTLMVKAHKLKLVAYAAYVTVDSENNLAGEIMWERLSQVAGQL